MPSPPDIGLLWGEPNERPERLDAALRFLAAGLGARLARFAPGGPVPERLLVIGSPGRTETPAGARLVLYLPPPLEARRALSRSDWIEPGPLPVFGPLQRYQDGGDLPWRYLGGEAPVCWASRGGQTLLQLGFDPLGPLAAMLAREPEAGRRAAWAEARVGALSPAEQTLVPNPWLDRLLLMLETLLDLRPGEAAGALPRWPGGARWAMALSHDVDMLFKWRLRSVLRLLLESPLHLLDGRRRVLARRWGELLERLRGGRDPWFLVDELLDLEERRGLHSTLLFLAEPRDHQTFRYHLDRPLVRGLLRRIRERGFETGLHGGWGSHLSAARLGGQRELLERLLGLPVRSTRQHWLRFDAGRTWDAQERAGLDCDSTLGFNDRPGFRAGTSLPFHPADAAGRPRRLLELPLALMDSQLFDEQGLAPREAALQALDLAEQVRRVRGLLTCNWHPHTLCAADFPGRRELLEWLLDLAAGPDCWAAGLGEVAARWREREAALGLEAPAAAAAEGGAPCAS